MREPIVNALGVILVFAYEQFELDSDYESLHTNRTRIRVGAALAPSLAFDALNLVFRKTLAKAVLFILVLPGHLLRFLNGLL